jgi:DUF971 family protein
MLRYILTVSRAVSSVWESATMALWRSPVRPRYGPPKGQSSAIVLFFQNAKMIPTQISLANPDQLSIKWDDGHASVISLRTLRDHCPCASCQGETVLLRTYAPAPQADLPGKYELTGARQVGHYALQISWGDGHTTGIYPWEVLRNLCECPECRSKKS